MSDVQTKQAVSEAEISMVLDTYMYMNNSGVDEGEALEQVIKSLEGHPDYAEGGVFHVEYTILSEAVENPEIGALQIHCQSQQMGYDTGTAACTFLDPSGDSVYVAYRGTGDGEWPDNGIALTCTSSIQQKQALLYFDEAMEQLDIGGSQRVIVTGHSKGGNKAQFVTMETQYDHLIDACYTADGQGFSESAIEHWETEYGEAGFASRQSKLYGIHGENDYVSQLGISIIPQDQIRYVSTPVEKGNFAGYHDIKYLFASMEVDQATGENVTIFHGQKNRDVMTQGELSKYAATLSGEIMKLEPDQRGGCAAVFMQVMESGGEKRSGMNGEKLTFSNIQNFIMSGMPILVGSFVENKEGRDVIRTMFAGDSFVTTIPQNMFLRTDYSILQGETKIMDEAARLVSKNAEELYEIKNQLPKYLSNGILIGYRMKSMSADLEKLAAGLRRASQTLTQIAENYQKWDCFLQNT